MALDEPKDTDEVIEKEDFKFVIDKNLLKGASPVKIDVTYTGFVVTSDMPLGGGGGCSSGSCGTGGGAGGGCSC